jgi:hypothetical protein
MGILDGYPFDPGSEGGSPPPGWLGLVLGAQAHANARAPHPAGEAVPAPVAPGHGPGLAPGTAPGLVPGLALALAPASAAQAAPPRPRFLAPGVKRIDGRLTGEKYLAQFSPEVQAAVKAAVAGRPVAEADQRPGFAQAIAAIARKYAGALSAPADAPPEPAAPAQPEARE